MLLTVTPEPTARPPRVRIEVESESSSLLVDAAVTRDGQPVRQSVVDDAPAFVLYDYEAPFGQTSTYEATALVGGAPATATATAYLDVHEAWLIHPSQPSLSLSIDAGRWREDGLNVDITSAQDVSRGSSATEFNIPGRSRWLVNRLGQRPAGRWTLVLFCPRLEDRDALGATLQDQTPLLLRTPPSWPWDLAEGWYSVGEVSTSRVVQALQNPQRRVTMPLTPVEEPVVLVAAAWNWGTVLLESGTWGALRDSGASWLDTLLGPDA